MAGLPTTAGSLAFTDNLPEADAPIVRTLKAAGAILGSIVYRFIIAVALRLDLPSECLKLISAVIVALAIGLPAIGLKKGGKAKC